MGARFIGVDREQVFLMPPSVRDWVPEEHLVWTVLDAVGELDLSAFYAAYRADGHGRTRLLRTTNRSATRPNPSHPMHRHDVGASDLAIAGSSSTVAVATRHTRSRAQIRAS